MCSTRGKLKPIHFPLLAAIFCLLLLCSCATQNINRLELPPETDLNPQAGRGDWILVKLCLEDGEELPFIVDTGAPITILDQSLEAKLGERLGTRTKTYGYLGKKRMGLYHAPKLFLNGIPLQTGSRIYTDDVAALSDHASLGILGVDCLRHYCVQFDFANRKIRFLHPDRMSGEDLGEAFPLTILFGGVFARADFFGAGKVYFRPDTGAIFENDAVLSPKLFQRELKKQNPLLIGNLPANGPNFAAFSKGIFGGQTYTNLLFTEAKDMAWENQDMLNLQFLARHLVTFDFPKRTLYLKQQSVGPLASHYFLIVEAEQFLVALGNKGQLPGLTNHQQVHFSAWNNGNFDAYPLSITFDLRRKSDASIYHYSVIRESKDAPWKLQKAWRADNHGHTLEEYPIP
jgi:hypothetical protein